MSRLISILESILNEEETYEFVIHVSEGKEDTDHFVGKNGEITSPAEELSDDDRVRDELKQAKRFKSIEGASEYFKQNFKGYTDYQVKNDEYHTAKYKRKTIQIVPLEHFHQYL